ncbi:MAG: hypothetical protein WCT05_16465 [Lentisphaeria bacterium]
MKINALQLKKLLTQTMDNVSTGIFPTKKLPPLMIWSGPGVGKSSIIRDLAQEYDIGFVDIRLAQREPVDLRGLPVPDLKKEIVKWLLSSEWPRDPKSRGIILFDELTAADRTLQVAAYELILDRRLGDLYKVPDGWYICAAGNRCEDRAVATTMSSALANRFLHVELEPDINSWVDWGQANGVHATVINFLRFCPDLLYRQKDENLERGWPSPRSWERVSTMLEMFNVKQSDLLRAAVYGLVGKAAGAEFLAFHSLGSKIGDVGAMMRGTAKIKIPKSPDQIYAFCAAINYHLWSGASPAEEKQLLDGFFKLSLALSSDFAGMVMADALGSAEDPTRHADRSHKLFGHPQYAAWNKCHGKAFRKYRGEE